MTVVSFIVGICVGILLAAVAIVVAASLQDDYTKKKGD